MWPHFPHWTHSQCPFLSSPGGLALESLEVPEQVLPCLFLSPFAASPTSSGYTSVPEEYPARAPALGTLNLWFGPEPRLSSSSPAVLILPLSLGLCDTGGPAGNSQQGPFEVAIPEHMGPFLYTKIRR